MFARQQQDLLRSLEFLQISDVLSVDPHARSIFDFGFSFKLNFSHHLIPRVDRWGEQKKENCKQYPQPPICSSLRAFHRVLRSFMEEKQHDPCQLRNSLK